MIRRLNRAIYAAGAHSRAGFKYVAVLFAAVLMVVVGAGFVGSVARAADDVENLSMFKVGSNVAGYFASALKPGVGGREFSEGWRRIGESPATAGAFLGYAEEGGFDWLISAISFSSQSTNYETLALFGDGAQEYAQFGATLKSLGLDGTISGVGGSIFRGIGGSLFLALYWSAALVNQLFDLVLVILDFTNPFRLVWEGVAGTAMGEMLSDELAGGDARVAWVNNAFQEESSQNAAALNGFVAFITEVYKLLSNLSIWVLAPVFIALALVMLLFSKKRGSVLKTLALRLFFMFVGVPVLGIIYTSSLHQLQEMTADGDSMVTELVGSTFVDFGAWATDYRLAVPSGAVIEYNKVERQASGDSVINVRSTALAINEMVNPGFGDGGASVGADLIVRYIFNGGVSSAAYNSAIQTKLSTTNDASTEALHWFAELASVDEKTLNLLGIIYDFLAGIGDNPDPNRADVGNNKLVTVNPSSGLVAKHEAVTHSGGVVSDAIIKFSSGSVNKCGVDPKRQDCSMSVLGVYNYLNNEFFDDHRVVYNPSGISTITGTRTHSDVNIVGTGFTSFLHWAVSFNTLAVFVFVALSYSFSMMFSSIKNGVRVLTAMPFAMLGMMNAIVKLVVFVVTIILELFGTIFLYKFLQKVLIELPMVFTFLPKLFRGLNDFSPALYGVAESGVSYGIILLFNVFLISFLFLAIRLRKNFVKAISEAATKLIEMVVGTGLSGGLPASSGGGALAGGAVGALAGTAAMGLGQNLLSGGVRPSFDGGSGGSAPAGGTGGVMPSPPSGGSGKQSGGGGAPGVGTPGGSTTKPSRSGAPAGVGVGGVPTQSVADNSNGLAVEDAKADKSVGDRVARQGLSVDTGDAGGGGANVIDSVYDSAAVRNTQQKGITAQKRAALRSGVNAAGHAVSAGVRVAAQDYTGAAGDAVKVSGHAAETKTKARDARRQQKRLDNADTVTPPKRDN